MGPIFLPVVARVDQTQGTLQTGWGAPEFWFDASDETSLVKDASGKVSYWNDKYSDKHLAQATSANQPTHGTRTYNGFAVIDFDGGDWMETINTVADVW